MKYKKSIFLKKLEHPSGCTAIYHSFFGYAMVLKNRMNAQLGLFTTPRSLSYCKNVPLELLQEFIQRGFLVKADLPEREHIVNQFKNTSLKQISGLSLDVATGCNFRCYHCIHFVGNELDARLTKPNRMSFETAKLAIDWVANELIVKGQTQIAIGFNGGEPLINWQTIQKILEYTRNQFQPYLSIQFSLNTNASLITPEIAHKLRKYDVEVVTSLDGIKEVNDSVRQTKRGNSTFNQIMRGFRRLSAAGMPVEALHVTLNSKNFDYLDDSFIQFLFQNGMINMTIEPDLTNRLKQPVSSLVEKIMELRKTARKKKITVMGYWELPFGKIIRQKKNLATHFCRSMAGEAIDVLPDRSIYSCSYTHMKHGHLDQLVKERSPTQLINIPSYQAMVDSRRVGEIDWCRGCEIEGVCGGGCYATAAHAQKRKDNAIIAYRCEFYRQITRQLLLDAIDQSIST